MNVVVKKKVKEIPDDVKDAIIDELLSTVFMAHSYQEAGVDALTILLQYDIVEWDDSDLARLRTALNNLIADSNISVNQLAKIAGVKNSTVYAWLNYPDSMPSIRTLYKVCNALGVGMLDFMKGVFE